MMNEEMWRRYLKCLKHNKNLYSAGRGKKSEMGHLENMIICQISLFNDVSRLFSVVHPLYKLRQEVVYNRPFFLKWYKYGSKLIY